MASQLDFMMQLYMMNLLQQQQQRALLQQQVATKSEEMADAAIHPQSPPTDSPPPPPLAGSANSNLNDLQQILFNNIPNSNSNHFVNNFLFPNFSSNFIQSSTVTSTPISLADEASIVRSSSDTSAGSRLLSPLESDSDRESELVPALDLQKKKNSFSFSPLKSPSLALDYTKKSSSSTDQTSSYLGHNEDSKMSSFSDKANSHFCDSESVARAESGLLNSDILQDENLKNLKKFSSYMECGSDLCRQENLREHFHCYDGDCSGRTLSKKDDIVRHLKWHKKRKESLKYGFMRFSSSDDCSTSYGAQCLYNGKQTHYHCVSEDCPKVYVSTSDVQMHANFHRRNSEIAQEGFQRFRAVDDCKADYCPFAGKNVSHFHCRRDNCQHTFKNKADMEKHKSYHLKDNQLTQDGFKKILKTETCPFDECRFSAVCNHIHCVREGCNYILHSSSQMISHKRKHDRLDGEQAYQDFKRVQKTAESDTATSNQDVYQTTPLSSLTSNASNFLSRKRGRPRKTIELPSDHVDKKIKLEHCNESSLASMANILPMMIPPFMPQHFMAPSQDLTAANFQLTHLMAMFQLQNPLVQNLYPPGIFGGIPNNFAATDYSADVKKEPTE